MPASIKQAKATNHRMAGAAAILAADPDMGPRALQRALNIPYSSAQDILRGLKRAQENADSGFEVGPLVEEELPIDDLVERRKTEYEQRRKAKLANSLVKVKVKIDGPYAIWHAGDPHVDDDGTDLGALERHTDVVRQTKGMFAANVGDVTNNWPGRLARLYSEQSTTAKQAWMLAEWLFERCPWLYVVGGNHDCYSGAGDPLQWIARNAGGPYKPHGIRLELTGRGTPVRINARHDFAGTSQWNPAHGQMKAIQMGLRDHISLSGHKHTSGYGVIKDPDTGRTCHAVQVASYKVHDRYAEERGFRDQAISPSVTTVIDPTLPDNSPDLVHVFWTPEEGAEYLKFKRSRYK